MIPSKDKPTRQIVGKQPRLIPITKIGIERRENNEKILQENNFKVQTILMSLSS